METMFEVYEDFMNYKSGVYKHVTGTFQGNHDVKVLGWGTEGRVNYWLAANSWGPDWGENGFFRIAEGECNFDSALYACAPALLKGNEEIIN